MPTPRSMYVPSRYCASANTVRRPGDAYFMFRAFIGGDSEAKLHCIHMEETERPDGDKDFKAIFFPNDPLEWFDM